MNDFEIMYHKSIKVSHNLVEDIRFSRIINLDLVKSCSDQICEYLNTDSNILALLGSMKEDEPYMFTHPVHVAFVSFVIGKWMKLNKSEISNLVFTGMVHDIGKAKISDKLLNKTEPLTDREMATMRTHTIMGYKILASLNVHDPQVLLGVLFHHERQDGTGYPKGLKGDQISLFGKIIAVADIYDAITSTKPYRIKSSPFRAVEEIQDSSFGRLDPKVCQAFLVNICNFYFGSTVRLSNEQIGEIVYVNPEEKTRPVIRCNNEFINLAQKRELQIIELIYPSSALPILT